MKHSNLHRLPLAWSLLFTACPSSGDTNGSEISSNSSSDPADTDTDSPPNNPTTGAAPDLTTSSPTTSENTDTTGQTDTTSQTDTTGPAGTSSDSGDTASESTGFTPSPTCGDGQPDPGEECDEGFGNNDNGACTLECRKAKCGDGLIWEGIESCDEAENNNDTLYGSCTTFCQLGAHCGDGIVQKPDEECDLGDSNGSNEFPPESVGCGDECRFDAKLLFLSSATYKGGDIADMMNKGVEGAHKKCQYLALQAQFDNANNFKAWLSDAQHSPLGDFTKPDKPYVRPDGVRVADSWDDLVQNGPHEAIARTDGGLLLPNALVWTNTEPNGDASDKSATCEDWKNSSSNLKSHYGNVGTDKVGWTAAAVLLSCNFPAHLYCFEQ